ncbi:hypothetical protein [Streptomyces sp. enrichment culture]|uniref:hypothetical protein n=1 Tax=Streptomyces sp. enrichment culture TaxID=1795815 RepID=UPI003F56FC8A
MGKAFVAKLARQGARDPEALAAWIGRKKHGRAAFSKLAAKGRKDGSGSSAAPARKPAASAAVRAKTMTRDERIAVNRRAREITTEEGLRAADARTPSEAEATTRAEVLERRAIDKAAARGVTPAGASEVTRQQDADAIRRRDDRVSLARVSTREQQERGRADVKRILAETRRFEAEQKAARLAPATEQEQRDIERAAAALVDRPEMLAQLDARLPQEADAESRREVIQRRAVDLARRRMAARI